MISKKIWHEHKYKALFLLSFLSIFSVFHLYMINNISKEHAVLDFWEQRPLDLFKIERLLKSKNSNSFVLKKGVYYDQVNFKQEFAFDGDPTVTKIEIPKGSFINLMALPDIKVIEKTSKEKIKEYLLPELSILYFISNHEMTFLFIILAIIGWIVHGVRNESFSNKYPIYYPEELEGNLNDLLGVEDLKDQIHEATLYLKNKKHFSGYGKTKACPLMFSGAPGTGKTKAASFIAKDLGYPIIYASAGNLETQYVGGGSISLQNIYRKALKHKKCVIFLDEADIILKQRDSDLDESSTKTINTLLSLIDGANTVRNKDIQWIIATNFNSSTMNIDPAMDRRFRKLDFRLPNTKERKSLFDHFLSKIESSKKGTIDTEFLASITSNLSPAIIESIVEKASSTVVINNLKKQKEQIIDTNVVYNAFEFITIGLTNKETTLNLDHQRDIIATHELGHFIVEYDYFHKKFNGDLKEISKKLNVLKISTEAVSRHNALGFVLSKEEEIGLMTKSQLKEKVKELYGGVCAEKLFFTDNGRTTGCENDLKKITKILTYMTHKAGMSELAVLDFSQISTPNEKNALSNEIINISNELFNDTMNIIDANKDLILFLKVKLLENYVLNKDEILKEIDNYNQSKKIGLVKNA